MRRIATAIAVAIVLTASVAADAATVNQTSDRTALRAYSAYLGSIVKRAKFGKADDAVLVKTVSGNCRGALAPVLKNSSRKSPEVREIGEEIGGDVAVKFLGEAHLPFKTLARKLDGLHWTGKGVSAQVHSFLSALRAVLAIAPSHLCRDVIDLSTKVGTEPAGTKAFLKQYLGDSETLSGKLTSLVDLLQRYETGSDSAIVTHINAHAARFNEISVADEKTSQAKLVAVLKTS